MTAIGPQPYPSWSRAPEPKPVVTREGFGAVLYGVRTRLNLSQSALGKRAGLDHSTVNRYESGERQPSRAAVDRLAHALNLNAEDADIFLAAAGFLPNDPVSFLMDEPTVSAILAVLRDDTVPATYRDGLRGMLRIMAEQARKIAS